MIYLKTMKHINNGNVNGSGINLLIAVIITDHFSGPSRATGVVSPCLYVRLRYLA